MTLKKLAVFAALLLSARLATAQAAPTASGGIHYQVGAGFSAARPDYGDKWITGATIFADADLARGLGVEFDYHDDDLGTPLDVGESTILGGLRYTVHYRRFRPYVKAMAGWGTLSYHQGFYAADSSSTYKVAAFGGGLEYPLTRRWTLRAIDAEYQWWPHFSDNGLSPFVMTSGVAYRF